MANFDISEMGYNAIKEIDSLRNDIMGAVAEVAGADGDTPLTVDGNEIEFTSQITQLAGLGSNLGGIDITTGAGALVLDDVLQAMSTVEQTAAQLVSAENKAQQQVNSLARQ